MSSVHDRLQRYGPFALAVFLLATSRWGSYLPTGYPPFIADIVLAILVGDRVLNAATHRVRRTPIDTWLAILTTALLVVTISWFLIGQWNIDALRDAAPYAYVLLAFLVLAPAESAVRPMEKAITVALIFHAVWLSVFVVAPGIVDAIPRVGNDVQLFLPRRDNDGLISGLLAGLALHRAFGGKAVVLNLGLAGASLAMTLALGSRGALLGVVAAVIAVLLLRRRKGDTSARSRQWAVGLVLLVSPGAIVLGAQGEAAQRLTATVSNLWQPTEDVAGAQGTASARKHSWYRLIEYLEADVGRNVFGVGFGPNFLVDSKADVELFGGDIESVRSPHNYLLGAWARLGLIGLAIIVALTIVGWRLAFLVGWRKPDHVSDVDVVAIMIVAGMPWVALVGVVLESPFGAVPYFWALGHLSAVACARRLVMPIQLRVRSGRSVEKVVRA
ncbi:MAG: O-antigen ligase family protein [Pseudonocardiaceae bacterium]